MRVLSKDSMIIEVEKLLLCLIGMYYVEQFISDEYGNN
jgi:hypothetical protein